MEPFFFIFLVMGIGGGIAYVNFVRGKGYLKAAAPCLESPQILGFSSPRLIGKYSGFSLTITVIPGGKSSPLTITMCIYTHTPFELALFREGPLQKIGKKMGVITEIEIGVPYFDEQYIIQTNSPPRAKAYLADPVIRNTVDELFTSGYTHFQIVDGALRFTRSSDDAAKDLSFPEVQAALHHMVCLARNL